ncbi:Patatin-like phospholipase [Nesidiocoris tenuis]|uniref:Patatin-like phospholipase n=1 Tax=Nesidiocoris tenuis TaxID=355587 RepID=A0ABN7B1T2_9HEMI|nr:Patatin-like phospholipase [Nesidiocoris tenuis]
MEEHDGLNMSFAGCGFLGLYYAGVAVCIKKYGAHLKFKNVSGASAGALAACTLLCDMSAEEYINDILEMVLEARNRTLGPFSPSFNLHEAIKKKLRKVLPQDAHVQVAGRLRVSLTRIRDGRNVIVSDFKSRDELVDCLAASSFVPVFSGLVPPKFRGVRYIDGMFTDNLPRLHDDTITVSPFSGESDICPRDDSTPFFHVNFSNTSIAMSLKNLYHFSTILWPPAPEVLAEFCKMGFDDALRYLQRHNYISCTRCLSIQSTYVISEDDGDYDPQCDKCDAARQDAVAGVLPEVVDTIFQGYIDAANKGLYNWLLSHRGVRVISLLTLPYTVPIDCAYAFIVKVRDLLPQMVGNLKKMTDFLVGELLKVLEKMGSKAGYKLSATLRMEYAIGGEGKCEDKQIKIDFHVDDRNLDVATLKAGKALSRKNSLKADDADSYDNILEVTSKHDAILAFYYTDENNKLQMTEIFDVTDCSECGIPEALETGLHASDALEAGLHASGASKSSNESKNDSDTGTLDTVLLHDKFENSDGSSASETVQSANDSRGESSIKDEDILEKEAVFKFSPPVDIPGSENRAESFSAETES